MKQFQKTERLEKRWYKSEKEMQKKLKIGIRRCLWV